MNPCPCGYAFNQDSRCQCSAEAIKRYQNRISGPLLDRIDLHIDVPPLHASELQDTQAVEDSATVRERVIQAYRMANATPSLSQYGFITQTTRTIRTTRWTSGFNL